MNCNETGKHNFTLMVLDPDADREETSYCVKKVGIDERGSFAKYASNLPCTRLIHQCNHNNSSA